MSEQRLIHTFGEEPQTFAFCLVNDEWTSSLMPKEITRPGELYIFRTGMEATMCLSKM